MSKFNRRNFIHFIIHVVHKYYPALVLRIVVLKMCICISVKLIKYPILKLLLLEPAPGYIMNLIIAKPVCIYCDLLISI
jgi:hypothetical protein